MSNYRYELDGLRAIAVLLVIFFHAGFAGFGGGYVGVDVFFVISGYLISSIIFAELQANTFGLVNFWERRARRILPALFVVMFSCLPWAWLWLYPDDLRRFSQSLVSVATFSSNFLFWKTNDYFEPASELKPLLHTWSLALEEQYYLLFPFFLLLVWRFGKHGLLIIFTVTAALSLALAQWASSNAPLPGFYLLPTRGWEFLIGAMVALYFQRESHWQPSKAASEAACWSGLLLLGYAVVVFDKQTPFPSMYTLVPTLGTALIILFASQQTVLGKLLGSKLLVGLGLISYSAYLWHQPLFAFARHLSLAEPSKLVMSLLILLTVVLAYLSWRFVETPFRNKQQFSRKKIGVAAIFLTLFFFSFGIAGHLTNGFDHRLAPDRRQFLQAVKNIKPTERGECDFYAASNGNTTRRLLVDLPNYCYEKSVKSSKAVLLWGDSHAKHLYFGLSKVLPRDWEILQITSNGCEPRLGATENVDDYCEYSNWYAVHTIKQVKPDVVVVAQHKGHSAHSIEELVEEIRVYGAKRVLVLGPVPQWTGQLPEIVVKYLWNEGNVPARSFVGIDTSSISNNAVLSKSLKNLEGGQFVNVIDYFCNQDGCLLYGDDPIASGLVSHDYGHFTNSASYLFARDVLSSYVVQSTH